MFESFDESNIFQILDHLHYEPNTFLIDNINQQNNYFTSYINEEKFILIIHSKNRVMRITNSAK